MVGVLGHVAETAWRHMAHDDEGLPTRRAPGNADRLPPGSRLVPEGVHLAPIARPGQTDDVDAVTVFGLAPDWAGEFFAALLPVDATVVVALDVQQRNMERVGQEAHVV